jgi:hypothetical protein
MDGDGYIRVSILQEDAANQRKDTRTIRTMLPSQTTMNALAGPDPLASDDDRPRWNPNERIPQQTGMFRLKVLDNMTAPKGQKRRMSLTVEGAGSAPRVGKTTLLLEDSVLTAQTNRLRQNAEKYFQALLKAEKKRKEQLIAKDYEVKLHKAEKSAKKATKRVIEREREEKERDREERLNRGEEVSEEEPEDEKEDGDEESEEESEAATTDDEEEIRLVPYDGVLNIEIDFSVLRAPHEDSDVSDDPDEADQGIAGPEEPPEVEEEEEDDSSEHDSDGALNLQEELAALQEEIGVEEEAEDEDPEAGLPVGLQGGDGAANIYNIGDPRLKLGIAGTVYFVPEAERYAFCPSLPPPPPSSLLGRRRIRMKPRLPLDISNNRYHDEHPNLWSLNAQLFDPPTSEDKKRFETMMVTHDFYASANKSMTQLPKMRSSKEAKKQRRQFESLIEENLRRRRGWMRRCKREWAKREKTKNDTQFGEETMSGSKLDDDAGDPPDADGGNGADEVPVGGTGSMAARVP